MHATPTCRPGRRSTATMRSSRRGHATTCAAPAASPGRCTACRSPSRTTSIPQDLPTEDGTVLHAGRRPLKDATLVSRLLTAGAVILGKTVTTEFAYFTPGKTRNPHSSSPHPRRFVQRFGGGGGRRDGAACRGNPDQRLGDPARVVLRRGGVQAEFRCHLAQRRAADLPQPRPGRRVRTIRARCGPHRAMPGRPRSGGCRHGQCLLAAACRGSGVGAAARSGIRPVALEALGAGRRRHPGGLR